MNFIGVTKNRIFVLCLQVLNSNSLRSWLAEQQLMSLESLYLKIRWPLAKNLMQCSLLQLAGMTSKF